MSEECIEDLPLLSLVVLLGFASDDALDFVSEDLLDDVLADGVLAVVVVEDEHMRTPISSASCWRPTAASEREKSSMDGARLAATSRSIAAPATTT